MSFITVGKFLCVHPSFITYTEKYDASPPLDMGTYNTSLVSSTHARNQRLRIYMLAVINVNLSTKHCRFSEAKAYVCLQLFFFFDSHAQKNYKRL